MHSCTARRLCAECGAEYRCAVRAMGRYGCGMPSVASLTCGSEIRPRPPGGAASRNRCGMDRAGKARMLVHATIRVDCRRAPHVIRARDNYSPGCGISTIQGRPHGQCQQREGNSLSFVHRTYCKAFKFETIQLSAMRATLQNSLESRLGETTAEDSRKN